MPFDPFKILKNIEKKYPKMAHKLAMVFLGLISPFNKPLGAKLLDWDDATCRIFIKKRRRLQNHVGSIHAGALFTLGETCAGFVIIRNFPFENYRPLMSDVNVVYTKQARGDVTGICIVEPEIFIKAKSQIVAGEIPQIEMNTLISNDKNELLATVTTRWQVKPWDLVGQRTK